MISFCRPFDCFESTGFRWWKPDPFLFYTFFVAQLSSFAWRIKPENFIRRAYILDHRQIYSLEIKNQRNHYWLATVEALEGCEHYWSFFLLIIIKYSFHLLINTICQLSLIIFFPPKCHVPRIQNHYPSLESKKKEKSDDDC